MGIAFIWGSTALMSTCTGGNVREVPTSEGATGGFQHHPDGATPSCAAYPTSVDTSRAAIPPTHSIRQPKPKILQGLLTVHHLTSTMSAPQIWLGMGVALKVGMGRTGWDRLLRKTLRPKPTDLQRRRIQPAAVHPLAGGRWSLWRLAPRSEAFSLDRR